MTAEFKPVPAVAKTCAIIRLLDASQATGLSLASISARLDVTKSHCLQILRTLEAEGWVAHDAERRRYRLAMPLLNDIAVLVAGNGQAARRQAVVDQLAGQFGLPCVLTRINADGSFTSISKAEPATDLLVISPLGFRYPPDAPAQLRARLAAMPPERAAAVLEGMHLAAHTAATLVDHRQVLREVARTRDRGYAVGRMEYQEGVLSIAAAVTDAGGTPVMVLQCTAPQGALAPREQAVGEAIRTAAASLGAARHRPPQA